MGPNDGFGEDLNIPTENPTDQIANYNTGYMAFLIQDRPSPGRCPCLEQETRNCLRNQGIEVRPIPVPPRSGSPVHYPPSL